MARLRARGCRVEYDKGRAVPPLTPVSVFATRLWQIWDLPLDVAQPF